MDIGVMTVKEVAAYMKIGLANAYVLVKQEGFPLIRVGRQMRVPKKALAEWMDSQKTERKDLAGERFN